MITREDIKGFLRGQGNKTKEEVVTGFTSWAISHGVGVDQLGQIIRDLRSYKEWRWGE